MNWLLDEGKEAGGFSLAFWLKSGGGIPLGGGATIRDRGHYLGGLKAVKVRRGHSRRPPNVMPP